MTEDDKPENQTKGTPLPGDGERLTQAVQAAQEYFGKLAPPGVSLADELIQERREEAARELAEEGGSEQQTAGCMPAAGPCGTEQALSAFDAYCAAAGLG